MKVLCFLFLYLFRKLYSPSRPFYFTLVCFPSTVMVRVESSPVPHHHRSSCLLWVFVCVPAFLVFPLNSRSLLSKVSICSHFLILWILLVLDLHIAWFCTVVLTFGFALCLSLHRLKYNVSVFSLHLLFHKCFVFFSGVPKFGSSSYFVKS